MTNITIIAAVAKNRVIGSRGEIPWRIPEDLKRFRDITLGHPVIMGRKTYYSISDPLDQRTNYVVTRNENFRPGPMYSARGGRARRELNEKIIVAHSLEEAIERAGEEEDEIFIIGGGEIFSQSMNLATRMRMTEVKRNIGGDVYFPEIDEDEWTRTEGISRVLYSFVDYVKK